LIALRAFSTELKSRKCTLTGYIQGHMFIVVKIVKFCGAAISRKAKFRDVLAVHKKAKFRGDFAVKSQISW
jgi:hypothetical protein